MDELPKNDFLTQEQYEKYLELYLLNKSTLNDTKNKICVNCQGGHVEVVEDTKTLLLWLITLSFRGWIRWWVDLNV